jgi:hypothetical protein
VQSLCFVLAYQNYAIERRSFQNDLHLIALLDLIRIFSGNLHALEVSAVPLRQRVEVEELHLHGLATMTTEWECALTTCLTVSGRLAISISVYISTMMFADINASSNNSKVVFMGFQFV